MSMSEAPRDNGRLRRIRSFVRRQGRVTAGQARALQEFWPEFGLQVTDGTLDMQQCFQREAPTVLEIGFGNGESLVRMAEHMPDTNFIGVEVHEPGVGALINGAERLGLKNIRVYCDDAIDVLNQCIPDTSLAGLQLFFPDPWHKKRHHKRRIVQPEFVALLARKINAGGYIHMATDWEPYAEHMLEVLSGSDDFQNKAGSGQYSPRPDYRPETKFERRGMRLGHGVWDLIFIKK